MSWLLPTSRFQLRQPAGEFVLELSGAEGPLAGVKAAGFAAAHLAAMFKLQQQMLHSSGGAAADGERHLLGQRETTQ